MSSLKKIIIALILLLNCNPKEEEKEVVKTRPEHIPNYAKQLENGEWLLRDFDNGYLAHWLNDGTPVLEAFLIRNLTEKIIITYPVLSNLKTFYRFKLIKENYFPVDLEDLKNLEDEDSREKRVTNVYFTMYLYGDINTNNKFYPREFFNTVMWNSGPNISFKNEKLFSFTCNTIISNKPEISTEICGTRYLYLNNSSIEKTILPIRCNHVCKDKVDIILKGYYKIKKYRHANIYQENNLDSKILKSIERNGIIQVLDNQVNISEITYSDAIWIKVKSGNIVGFMQKSNIINRKL